MNYPPRPPKPDVYEIIAYARRRVFVRVSENEHLMIVSLKQVVSVHRFRKGEQDSTTVTVWRSAEDLGIFDGSAWDIPALATWISQHCVVCWQPLEGKQRTYCSDKCRQKAYRERRK